ncbi:26S proteasome non-ATPase regulatory subunit 5-like [Mizuhopecten yessoensis]|uniref:26S proteasome non-ATPase regulatory subunit 5 n=1 Tax=Mizuhopecten yessoensis TaxID=6573 RepID=A0A210R0X3_MIZYE|nr:26S proteasome non-ATPase regulatory subunit 5-like [Mizuhopecten yessoensis]OWF54683.1 26S proteasome non-ATPase regulatory subunit 5 [Mizuhopecten yessoensis]
MASDIVRLLGSLSLSDNPIEKLEELKTVIFAIHPSVLASHIGNLSFQQLFSLLNTENGDQLELCCDILSRLLTALGPPAVLSNFYTELSHGLSHKAICVQCLSLQQLQLVSEDNQALEELLRRDDILHQIIRLISCDSVDVSSKAIKVISCLGQSAMGLTALYTTTLLQTLQQVMDSNETVRFRVYELLVKIRQMSVVSLEYTYESGMLQQLLNEVHKDDILLQLNCIELLSDLALSEHCLVFLDQQGIISKLDNMIASVESDPMAGLLLPGLIKFFGGMARFHPKEVCSEKSVFMNTVLDNTSNSAMASMAIQTVGFIGSTPEGKVALDKWGGKLSASVSDIAAVLRSGTTELKINALQAVERLLTLKVEDQTTELLALTEKWFNLLGREPLRTILEITQQPFTDLRCVAYQVFVAMATQQWAQECMNKFPGLTEFLLDRLTESTKEGKDAKHALVKTLAESPFAANSFGNPFYVKLKAYCVQGPYFLRAQAEVAMEGE